MRFGRPFEYLDFVKESLTGHGDVTRKRFPFTKTQILLGTSVLAPKTVLAMEARLQVSLSAHGLRNLAGFRNTSDPFAVLSLRGEHKDDPPTIVGQTEV